MTATFRAGTRVKLHKSLPAVEHGATGTIESVSGDIAVVKFDGIADTQRVRMEPGALTSIDCDHAVDNPRCDHYS